MTPTYAATLFGPAGGYTDTTLDPQPIQSPVEMIWIVNGPGLPPNAIYEKIGEEATAMHFLIFLRSTGRQLSA